MLWLPNSEELVFAAGSTIAVMKGKRGVCCRLEALPSSKAPTALSEHALSRCCLPMPCNACLQPQMGLSAFCLGTSVASAPWPVLQTAALWRLLRMAELPSSVSGTWQQGSVLLFCMVSHQLAVLSVGACLSRGLLATWEPAACTSVQ